MIRRAITELLGLGMLLFCIPYSPAAVVLGEHDWETPSGTLEGWETGDAWAGLSNPGGYLQITLAPTDPTPGPEWSTLVTVDAADLFAGNWTSDMWIEFDFMAQDYVPASLQVQWQGDSGYTWSYVITPSSTLGDWVGYGASFGNWEDWAFPGATEELFLQDLSSIDWIGIYIFQSSPEGQIFGLDNFRLLVPEPHEYAMLAVALVVVLVTLRRRKAHEILEAA